ncbi:MAG: hypothetical protein ACOVP7_12225 [Lacibacter sp.]
MKSVITALFFSLFFVQLQAQVTLHVDITTGDDNLERKDYQKNPELVIVLKDRREIRKENINRGQNWENNTTRRVAMELPEGVRLQDLSEILLYRERDYTKGREQVWDYLKKDNWTVKAMLVTAVFKLDGQTRQYDLLKLNPRGNLYRFVFDETNKPNEGYLFKHSIDMANVVFERPRQTANAIITATVATGADDLRGGRDNMSVRLKIYNSSFTINLDNMNKSVRWNNHSEYQVSIEIPNSSGLDINSISEVVVRHTGGSGNDADNWNLNRLKLVISKNKTPAEVQAAGLKSDDGIPNQRLLVNKSGSPLHRFTGQSREKAFVTEGANNQAAVKNATLTIEAGTGDDDLRGGSDNISIYIRFKNSTESVSLLNVNNRENWPNNSVRVVSNKELLRSYNININDIKEVELRHTGGSGMGADNWNLTKLKISITKEGRSRVLVDLVAPLIHRFTGSERRKVFTVE